MKKKMTTVAFCGTAEQRAKLDALIAKYKDSQGNMMPVLQGAQDIYGYLPIEVQKIIAEGLGVSLAEVYGVVSFYSQFALNPKGKIAISVCLGTACYVRGAAAIFDKVEQITGVKAGEIASDGIYSFDATRCIGSCGLAPAMVINGDVYARMTPDQVKGILDKYKA